MTDKFSTYAESLESPPSNLIAVTPDDAADLPSASRGLNVAQGGMVRVTTVGGTTGTLMIEAGGVFPLRATRIWATGTTATGIVAMF